MTNTTLPTQLLVATAASVRFVNEQDEKTTRKLRATVSTLALLEHD